MTKGRYYVYALCWPNGDPFYIGKGKGYRAKDHEIEARSGVSNRKCEIIRSIWADGGRVITKILLRTNNEIEAYQEEIRQIAAIGRENLVNKTNGGGGSRVLTAEEDIAKTLCTCPFCTREIAEFLERQRYF